MARTEHTRTPLGEVHELLPVGPTGKPALVVTIDEDVANDFKRGQELMLIARHDTLTAWKEAPRLADVVAEALR